ncbi:MAG: nucleotidyltransferase domain-containing protein [Deltaproteobacteria bacterium]|nr:nucleotidyltransferase domain-containing protein [Deltaproteobacteria bacterium]
MNETDYKTASALKQRLGSVVSLVDFKVFGSRARGDGDEYSDMDVFIEVVSLDKGLKEKISKIVWEVGFENYTFISSLVFTKEEIENTPIRSSSIIKNIFADGITI